MRLIQMAKDFMHDRARNNALEKFEAGKLTQPQASAAILKAGAKDVYYPADIEALKKIGGLCAVGAISKICETDKDFMRQGIDAIQSIATTLAEKELFLNVEDALRSIMKFQSFYPDDDDRQLAREFGIQALCENGSLPAVNLIEQRVNENNFDDLSNNSSVDALYQIALNAKEHDSQVARFATYALGEVAIRSLSAQNEGLADAVYVKLSYLKASSNPDLKTSARSAFERVANLYSSHDQTEPNPFTLVPDTLVPEK